MPSFLRSKKPWVLGVLLLVVVGVVMRAPWKHPATMVETFNPRYQDLRKTLSVSGETNARSVARLRFLAGGKITYIGAKEGDTVKKWQSIAGIDKQALQNTFAQQLNSFTAARVTFDQLQTDTKDINGNQTVDRNRQKGDLTLQNAALTVEQQDIALKNTTLYSPIAGILVSSPTNTSGVILSPTDTFLIVDPSSLYFDAEVDESNLAQVRPGQTAKIVLDAYPQEKIESVVQYVAFQSTQSTTGTGTVFRVRLQMPALNSTLKYKLGMNGTAEILVDQKLHVLTVPVTSVVEKNGQSYVDVQIGTKVESRQLQKGLETDQDVEIISGVSPADKVIKK